MVRVTLGQAEQIIRPFGHVYYFPLMGGLPDLPLFEGIIDLYDERRGTGLLPKKESFNFRDLRGWHARFCLTLFKDDCSDGQIRILGEDYRMLFGDTLRQGMYMSETSDPMLPGLVQYFRELLTRPAIGYFTGALPEKSREHVNADILDLPATDSFGRNLYILSFIREHVGVSGA